MIIFVKTRDDYGFNYNCQGFVFAFMIVIGILVRVKFFGSNLAFNLMKIGLSQ